MQYFISQIFDTFINITKVREVEKLILFFKNQVLDLLKLTILNKSLKVAKRTIAEKYI